MLRMGRQQEMRNRVAQRLELLSDAGFYGPIIMAVLAGLAGITPVTILFQVRLLIKQLPAFENDAPRAPRNADVATTFAHPAGRHI